MGRCWIDDQIGAAVSITSPDHLMRTHERLIRRSISCGALKNFIE
jgi:hypothetical protein